ncbi:hypothetical protein BDAP_000554 [Binucleata daphniae]
MMQNNDFDWYEDGMEVETPEFHPTETKRTIIEKIFDICTLLYNYITLALFVIYIFRLIFSFKNSTIVTMKTNTIILSMIVYFGSLPLITNIIRFIKFICLNFTDESQEKKVNSAYRWVSLSLWYLLNLYLVYYIKQDIIDYYDITKAYLQCGLLASISFTAVTIIMEYFYEYFLEKSLYLKMRDVEIRERILAAMKNYRYELAESSSSSVSRECSLKDLIFYNANENTSEENENHIELKKWNEKRVGKLYLKIPELISLYDANTMARDVFTKASEGNDVLTFDSFCNIFPNDQIALQALPFFESNDKQEITKKEFRDTIVQFYVDRVNLEKNFRIAKGFVDIADDIFCIVVLAFLLLAFLIIFGIPLKELVALALSSALLLNFLVSGVASDLYFNFMVLLSHPFDIGDEIIIDGVDYKVYKISLATTTFIATNGGKVKFLNSGLWKRELINMTRAPEKILVFDFKLSPEIDVIKFQLFKSKIQRYLRERQYDFYESFSFEAKSEKATGIEALECTLILKCKNYKTKTKKLNLRVEITGIILELFKILDMKTL